MPLSLSRYLVHVGHTRHVPLADVCVERRPCGTRWVEQTRHARHRCGVPVGDRTVRRRRRCRIGQPRRCGHTDVCVGDGRLSSDMRGQHEEQSKAGEAVRPPREGPAAQEATRRVATRCDTLQRGMCCTVRRAT